MVVVMSTQHTPGPWELVPASSFCPWPAVIRGKTGGFLVHGISKQLCEADARLIAAAPDLLEALRKFALKHRHTYGLDGAWDEEITTAEKAIAKATGETK
jgi:hypothetical protein